MELFFLILLVVMLASALGSGYPVAFAIPGSAILTVGMAALGGYVYSGDVDAFFVHGGGPSAWLSAGVTNIRGIYRSDERDTLIAIPLFIFMGLMLQRSKVSEDLLLAMAKLFGGVRGGLGVSVILVGALLAATTGVIGATVVAMGLISLPTMLRSNYSKSLAAGVIAATGTLGQIIPPSIVLLILIDQLTTAVNEASVARRALFKDATGDPLMPSELDVASVSVGDIFIGAIAPGLILVGLYILYVLIVAVLRPDRVPAVAFDRAANRGLGTRLLRALFPPLALILIVLGSIVSGVATVNQAGAIGAAGATVMAGARLREGQRGAFGPLLIALLALVAIGLIVNVFNVNLRRVETAEDVLGVALAAAASVILAVALGWSAWRTFTIGRTMQGVMDEATKMTSLVFAILLGAAMFTAAFRAFGGQEVVRDLLHGLPGGFWGKFTIAMLVIFVLGFFLDFIEITALVVPIVAPVLLADPAANITAVWLGVMIAMIIQTSFLTPPFGFALFYLRGVAPPSVRTIDIYRGVVPFIALQLLAIGIIGLVPSLVNYLPARSILMSESAPPPTNPRLQRCLESYVGERLEEDGESLRAAIAQVRGLDLAVLPERVRTELSQSFGAAADAVAAIGLIGAAERAVSQAGVEFRPRLIEVRGLERDIRGIESEILKLETRLSRNNDATMDAGALQARIAELIGERTRLAARIPAEWDSEYSTFAALLRAEDAARRAYRRNADQATEGLDEVLAMIADGSKLQALEGDLRSLEATLGVEPAEIASARLKQLTSRLSKIAGVDAIRDVTRRARRSLRADPPAPEAAKAEIGRAAALLQQEIAWRRGASSKLRPALEGYRTAIADTVGLRGGARLPKQVASSITTCAATPRDIVLYF